MYLKGCTRCLVLFVAWVIANVSSEIAFSLVIYLKQIDKKQTKRIGFSLLKDSDFHIFTFFFVVSQSKVFALRKYKKIHPPFPSLNKQIFYFFRQAYLKTFSKRKVNFCYRRKRLSLFFLF